MVYQKDDFRRNYKIEGNGTWVLGQDQDSVGGGFQIGDAMQGEMTEVNIWKDVLSEKEIIEFSSSCQSNLKGNVKSWENFKYGVKGEVIVQKNPSCCEA